MKKIAFLFMIYETFEKEDIWYKFFENIDENKYSIYIHGKDKNKIVFENDFFKKFIINEEYQTNWGDYTLINLQNRLYELSIKDENNYKFILMSGTHIPLHNFDFIYDFLIKNNKSYINYFQNNNDYYKKCIYTVNNYKKYNLDCWYVASQWSIFNREIINFILENELDIKRIFEKSKLPDEIAYINYLRENNKMINISNHKTTYYSMKPSKKIYKRFPHTFDDNELNLLNFNKIKKNYLFMRKVVKSCNIQNEWIFSKINNFNLLSPAIINNLKKVNIIKKII